MSTPKNPRREQPGTYFVQDRFSEDELTRLRLQDQQVTAGMGGVLPEQADPASFQRVLDVGCGSGDWLIEAAKTYPKHVAAGGGGYKQQDSGVRASAGRSPGGE